MHLIPHAKLKDFIFRFTTYFKETNFNKSMLPPIRPQAGLKNGLYLVLDMKPGEMDIQSSISYDFKGVEINVGAKHTFPMMATNTFLVSPGKHGCQMAIARFLDRLCLALRASGLRLRYAALQNLIPSFPWISPPCPPPWRNPRKGRVPILPSGNLAGKVTMVEISGEKRSTSGDFNNLSLDERQCYFEYERPLQLFSNYTSDNCWIECLINRTRMENNNTCTPWNMPSPNGHRCCNPMEQKDFFETFGKLDMSIVMGSELCLSDCASTVYSTKVTTAPFRKEPYLYDVEFWTPSPACSNLLLIYPIKCM